MKIINPLNIQGYNFNELSQEAQEKVLTDHINFWMETREYDQENPGSFEKAIDRAEELQTPWFAGCYVYDYCKDEIIEEIQINNYLFDDSGELLPITYYTKGNEVIKTTYQISKNNEIEITLN